MLKELLVEIHNMVKMCDSEAIACQGKYLILFQKLVLRFWQQKLSLYNISFHEKSIQLFNPYEQRKSFEKYAKACHLEYEFSEKYNHVHRPKFGE